MYWFQTPESSNINRIAYDEQNQVLFVEFKQGGVYQYFDVSGIVFEELKAATSKGQYLAQRIKGNYRYARK